MALTLYAATEHRAFQDVEGNKPCLGAVAGIVVRLRGEMPGSKELVGRIHSNAWI